MPAFSSHIFITAGLCLVAYLLGIRRRELQADLQGIQTIRRANEIVTALQGVIDDLRRGVREHQTQIAAFQGRLRESNAVGVEQVEAVVSTSHELVSKLVLSQGHISEELGRLKELTQSRIDSLTGAGNRRSFEEELEILLARLQQSGQGFALAWMDVDNFKAVNDTFGHPAGDKVLQELVKLFSKHIRQTDSVARMGGDEFVILMPNSDGTGAGRVLERIRKAVEATAIQSGDKQVRVTISSGVVASSAGETNDSLICRVDSLLYRAKHQGRNQVCIQDTEPDASAVSAAGRFLRQAPPASPREPQTVELSSHFEESPCGLSSDGL